MLLFFVSPQVISTARTCNLIYIVLDCLKPMTHKRLIDILDSRAQTVDALTKLDLPAGVDVEIKI